MSDPVETSELLAFAKTVSAKSLSRAAVQLGVPRATVSRRLARLEQRLGTRLLRRTTRSLVLTDAGQTLYRHASIVLDAVDQAEASVRRTDNRVRGDVRVAIPPVFDRSLSAFICEFVEAHPDVRLQVHAATRHVDLVREGFDVALRAGTHLEPGLIARTIARTPAIAVASPAYLQKFGTPQTRRDLAKHRCIMGFALGDVAETHWPFLGGGLFQVEGAFASNDISLRTEAAVRGLGIAILPAQFVMPLLESGALLHVLSDVIRVDAQVAVVYPERELMPPQVRAFIDALIAWGATGLITKIPGSCQAAAKKLRKRHA